MTVLLTGASLPTRMHMDWWARQSMVSMQERFGYALAHIVRAYLVPNLVLTRPYMPLERTCLRDMRGNELA